MAKDFNLTFTNGTAPTKNIEYGTYNLSKDITGYDGALTPSQITVPNDIVNGALPITVNGTGSLTLTLYGPDGTTPVTDAIFKRYLNASDTTAYLPIPGTINDNSSSSGLYVINNVPYIDGAAYKIYLSISSQTFGIIDEPHPIEITLKSETQKINLGT